MVELPLIPLTAELHLLHLPTRRQVRLDGLHLLLAALSCLLAAR